MWNLIKFSIFICLITFVVSFVFSFCKNFLKRPKFEKPKKVKKMNFFKKYFIVLPSVLAKNLLFSNPYDFKESGLILFEGEQGSGKTVGMTDLAYRLKQKYPDLLIFSNYGLTFEDEELTSWQPIVGELNGKKGFIANFDEISIWFSNRNYKNFPPQLLRCITQNRKEHRLICGTCQQVNMVDKQIRRQCTEIRKARTFFGCWTWVWRSEPVFSSDGDIISKRPKGFYTIVQTDELRSLYDTFRVVENLGRIGFAESEEVKKDET